MQRAAVILAAATASALAATASARLLGATAADAAPVVAAPALRTTTIEADAVGSVRKAADGHYWAEATVDGRHVRFLVDTGASVVALTQADARRLGLAPGTLTYDRPVETAAGPTMAAAVELGSVSVAGARLEDVEALILRDGLTSSLLGMSYLGRLSRFEATADQLILRR